MKAFIPPCACSFIASVSVALALFASTTAFAGEVGAPRGGIAPSVRTPVSQVRGGSLAAARGPSKKGPIAPSPARPSASGAPAGGHGITVSSVRWRSPDGSRHARGATHTVVTRPDGSRHAYENPPPRTGTSAIRPSPPARSTAPHPAIPSHASRRPTSASAGHGITTSHLRWRSPDGSRYARGATHTVVTRPDGSLHTYENPRPPPVKK